VIPPPIALGLTLCDLVIVEEDTRKVSLIGNLTRWTADNFPYTAPPFFAFSALTGSVGEGRMDLVVARLDTGEDIYRQHRVVHFTDRLRELHLILRVGNCVLLAAGWYQATLLADQEWVAQRRFRVIAQEAQS
jgi:hypothetical protein